MNRPTIQTPGAAQSLAAQNLTVFRVYAAYRSLLSLLLLIMLISPNTRELVGSLNPSMYLLVALAYLASNALLMGGLFGRMHGNNTLLFLIFFTDILAITLLSDASGGMISGLPILLVISVAASAIMIPQRTLSVLVAALSAIAILADSLRLISIGYTDIGTLFPTGLLGLLLFGVALLVQVVAARLGKAEELARNRASDLYNLQRLNEQIVQHMQTGILLISDKGDAQVMNKAALRLLAPQRSGSAEQGRELRDYSVELASQWQRWRDFRQHKATPITIDNDAPDVIANFRILQPDTEGKSLVFVEDYTPVKQYAQSLKLTSLGRLTASIAHEIRNPLGAVSHAAQLLQESPDLVDADRRMADIILDHSRRMNHIIESVMQISRREPPKPQVLLLADWLKDFVEGYVLTLEEGCEITIHCEYPELQIEFDPENLHRILRNLLENGMRHSALLTGKSSAELRVELDFTSNRCHIDVEDDGEGVAPADQSKLFEPFYTTVAEGSGMGLFLCKELCEINNATLSYMQSSRGKSCLRISLPQRAMQ